MIGLARLLAGLVLLVSTTAGALVLTAGPAAACSCVGASVDFLDTHDVAFSGVVKDQRVTGDHSVLTVSADRVFKGEVTRKVDIVGEREGSACGFESQVDDRVIVFADKGDPNLTGGLCATVTAPSQSYRQLLDELGGGTEPTPGYQKAELKTLGLTYEQFVAGRAILGVLGLAVLGYFVFRAWRARRRTNS